MTTIEVQTPALETAVAGSAAMTLQSLARGAARQTPRGARDNVVVAQSATLPVADSSAAAADARVFELLQGDAGDLRRALFTADGAIRQPELFDRLSADVVALVMESLIANGMTAGEHGATVGALKSILGAIGRNGKADAVLSPALRAELAGALDSDEVRAYRDVAQAQPVEGPTQSVVVYDAMTGARRSFSKADLDALRSKIEGGSADVKGTYGTWKGAEEIASDEGLALAMATAEWYQAEGREMSWGAVPGTALRNKEKASARRSAEVDGLAAELKRHMDVAVVQAKLAPTVQEAKKGAAAMAGLGAPREGSTAEMLLNVWANQSEDLKAFLNGDPAILERLANDKSGALLSNIQAELQTWIRTLELTNAIRKAQHDVAMSIIRNIA